MKRKAERLVRVIRDVRDAERDYYITESDAKEKYNNGTLCMAHAYNTGWDYMERTND